MLSKLSIIGAVGAILLMPTALPAQARGAAIAGAAGRGIPTGLGRHQSSHHPIRQWTLLVAVLFHIEIVVFAVAWARTFFATGVEIYRWEPRNLVLAAVEGSPRPRVGWRG